jgi:hypothetical protein
MGMTLGAILFGKDSQGDYPRLLERLGLANAREAGTLSLAEAGRGEFSGSALGVYRGATLLVNPFLPYDCSYQPEELSPLDEKLAALSQEAPVLCFYLDETSMSFAFAWYQGGARTRGRKVDPDRIYADFGDPLPAEAGFDPASRDDSQRILALTAVFLGEPLGRVIHRQSLDLALYAA